MAVLNIRIDDDYRGRLREKAEEQDVSLSEYVRRLVVEDVVDVRGRELVNDIEPAPTTMSLWERQMLSLQLRTYASTLPEGPERQSQIRKADILEEGYVAEYGTVTAGFLTELSHLDCTRVIDILQMFSTITCSMKRLSEKGEAVDAPMARYLTFLGFDHNDTLESRMASYVEFLTEVEGGWEELLPQIEKADKGNSHKRVLETYLRMLNEYRRIMDPRIHSYNPEDYFLSLEDLQRLSEARVHPSRR